MLTKSEPITRRHCTSREASGVACEERAEGEAGSKTVISGYAAVFYDGTPGTEYELVPGVAERIMPGAFSQALRSDVRGLFNHDPTNVLGRTEAGTMRLSVTKRGLRYTIDPPDTQMARDLMTSIRRGDVSGSSFGFRVTEEEWVRDGDQEIVEIRGVQLHDVGPVTFPAYRATDSEIAEVRRYVEHHRKARLDLEWRAGMSGTPFSEQRIRVAGLEQDQLTRRVLGH